MRPAARALTATLRHTPRDPWTAVGAAITAWLVGYALTRTHTAAWACAGIVGILAAARAIAERLADPEQHPDTARIAELEADLGLTATDAPDILSTGHPDAVR